MGAAVSVTAAWVFVATSIGYGLAVESLDVAVSDLPPVVKDKPAPLVNLGDLTFKQFPTSALQDGVRVRPNFLRIAFANSGRLNTVPTTTESPRPMARRQPLPPFVASIVVPSLVTFVLSAAGVMIGRAGARALGPQAEIVGGLILIVIGAKVLIDHRAFG